MLGKLMKYDLKELYKKLLPIYLIGVIVGIISKCFDFAVDNVSALSIPATFMNVIFVAIVIFIPIYTFILIISNYYKSMVRDEAYLTHTLPVSKHSLVLSKLFDGIIVSVSSVLVSLASVFLRFIGYKELYKIIKEAIKMAFNVYNTEFIILVMISICISFIMFLMIIFTAISLGQLHNNKKVVMSCIYTVALYYINQMIGVILIVVPMLFNSDFFNMMNSNNPPMDILNLYMILSICVNIALLVIYYFATIKIMSKKLNLE